MIAIPKDNTCLFYSTHGTLDIKKIILDVVFIGLSNPHVSRWIVHVSQNSNSHGNNFAITCAPNIYQITNEIGVRLLKVYQIVTNYFVIHCTLKSTKSPMKLVFYVWSVAIIAILTCLGCWHVYTNHDVCVCVKSGWCQESTCGCEAVSS